MWFHCCARLKDNGFYPFDFKRKDFVSITVGTGVSLQGATSKLDSMWHSSVFACISPNRVHMKENTQQTVYEVCSLVSAKSMHFYIAA